MSPQHSIAEIASLVRKAQGGSEESFGALYDIFYERIFRYVRFRVPQIESEDLTAEVFLKVVKNLKSYQPTSGATFSSWVFRIAHNVVIDFYRKKQELLGLQDPESGKILFETIDPNPTPDENLKIQQRHEHIRNTLTKLAPPHQEIIELKFLEELSNREILIH